MFRLYFHSGHFTALREAVRAAQFYAGRQNANGFFAFGGVDSDAKYAYNESLAYTLWTTGDPQMPARIARTPLAQASFAHAWTPQRGFWTERAHGVTTGLDAGGVRDAQSDYPDAPLADPEMPIPSSKDNRLTLDLEGLVLNADGTYVAPCTVCGAVG